MANDNFMYSPADGLSDGFNVGGGSTPAAPSVYPEIDMTGASGDTAQGSKAAESFGMMSESPGAVQGVQLATGAPEGYSPDPSDSMVGGLGTPPKP